VHNDSYSVNVGVHLPQLSVFTSYMHKQEEINAWTGCTSSSEGLSVRGNANCRNHCKKYSESC